MYWKIKSDPENQTKSGKNKALLMILNNQKENSKNPTIKSLTRNARCSKRMLR